MSRWLPEMLDKARDNLWQWLSPALGVALTGIVVAGENYFATLIPKPPEVWAVRAIALSLALIGLLVGTYFWYRNKHIFPRPNLKNKTELQDQILNALTTPVTPQMLSEILNRDESLVLYNLELLESDLLVHSGSYNSPSWRLSKHGRKYLHAETS